MHRSFIAVLVQLLVGVACIPSSRQDTSVAPTSSRQAVSLECGIDFPPTPTCPTRLDLSGWSPPRRFYETTTTRSAITIVMHNPVAEPRTRFWAFGFDVLQGNCVFFVDGLNTTHYPLFMQQITDDTNAMRRAQLVSGGRLNVGSDGDIYIDIPPPPMPPSPPVDEWAAFLAFKAAVVVYNSTEIWSQFTSAQ